MLVLAKKPFWSTLFKTVGDWKPKMCNSFTAALNLTVSVIKGLLS
uniref:Uncharacterized protein n=1 Tax=Anguilla anguilla TaxID=7936 RepID=A0A0E9WJI2_ANGAN